MARHGLRTEVLLSLGLVMLLATIVLVAVLASHHEQGLRRVLGRSLRAEASGGLVPSQSVVVGTEWWQVGPDGAVQPRGGFAGPIDAETRSLADEARQARAPLLQLGVLGGRIRFATPLGPDGGVAAARLPAEASMRMRSAPLLILAVLGLANVAIFTGFGAWLLQRRVLDPLQAVAATADQIATGEASVRARERGPGEVAAVARALNTLTDSLQGQSEELEKAVFELRERNRDLRQARAGLDRAERLASVGRLAAGVAHEVGNPIGAILTFLELARRDEALAGATRDHLERAGKEGERVRTILRQLLDFSRPARTEPRPVDLHALAEETLALVRPQRRYADIDFELSADDGLPPALADEAAVTQILLNLLLNAADAVGEAGGSRIAIRLRPAVMERREGDEHEGELSRRAPDAVECVVCDDGCGIPEQDRDRIFDPFYTTKPPGEGTGLGLANSARMAEELGGRVEWVKAPEGFETAFALRLRRAGGEVPNGVRRGGASPR